MVSFRQQLIVLFLFQRFLFRSWISAHQRNMDAYSMTCTSPTLRHMSRIYLDLKSIHCQTISGLNPNHFDRPLHTMGPKTRVSQRPIDCLLCCIHEQPEAHDCTWLRTTHTSLP